jgi:hypothetical protein
LQHAYGDGAGVTLSHDPVGGTIALARLPFNHA